MSFGRHKKSLIRLLKKKHANEPIKNDDDSDQYEERNSNSSSEEQVLAPQVKVENESEVQEFHAWECISLLQKYSTLDF